MRREHSLWISIGIAAALLLLLILSPARAQQGVPSPSSVAASAAASADTTGKDAKETEKPREKPAKNGKDRKKGKDKGETGGGSASPGDIYLRNTSLDDAAQLISQIGKTSIVVTSSVSSKTVSLYLRDVDVEGMIRSLCRAAGVWYRYDMKTNAYILMSAQEYQQDIIIARDDITRSYVLRHHNVVSIAYAIQALFGGRVMLTEPQEEESTNLGGDSMRRSVSGRRSTSYSRDGMRASSRGGSNAGGNEIDPRRALAGLTQNALDTALDTAPDVGAEDNQASRGRQFSASALFAASRQTGAPINITYNLLHNLLLVRTSDDAALRDIDVLVREMDRPPRQVLLEMKILEVELGSDFRSIFDIGWSEKGVSNGPQELGFGGSPSPGRGSGPYPGHAASLGNFAEDAATAVWQRVNDRLRLRLQLLENEDRINVLATPMVVAGNNQEARLFVGSEHVLVTGANAESVTGTTGATTSIVTVDTEQRNIGQTLIIHPRINDDRTVTLTINQDNSNVIPGGATLPLALPNGAIYNFAIDTVNTANLQVTAHARDGMTVAVGGMISQRIANGEDKVPWLGDVPLLGHLFKKTIRENTRSQLVLLITPWVMETPEESDAFARRKEADLLELDRSDTRRGNIAPGGPPPRNSILTPPAVRPATRPVVEGTTDPAAVATVPTAAAASASGDDTARLASVARAATAAVRQGDPSLPPPDGLERVSLAAAQRRPRRLNESLEIQALFGWQRDGIYVTALRVVNLGDKPASIAPTQIAGRWAAIVVERQQLAAAGGETSWTWVYALSRQPYEHALAP
ncbi:MAG: hypothetical protein LBO79_04455 [Zoogloeaceae bacterium]|jgi:general secretion pathway protein D|nr:hypothetical protein [Zoogloeaceae bacterium]